MLNLHTLWTLAVAEMRSCRRLARTWIIFGITLAYCIGWYINKLESAVYPSAPSGWAPSQINPQLMVAEMMSVLVAMFSFGLIFLAFDIRARDVQNRIHEIVDSLPANNVEVILGRIMGILLLFLLFILLFIGLVACYEAITGHLGIRYRVGIHPLSLVSLLVWSIIPILVFFGALVACLSTLVRNRLVVAVIALGAVWGTLWIEDQIPVYLEQIFSPFVGNVIFPSDLTPVFVTPAIAISRFAIILESIALLLYAAALLPRTEPRRKVLSRLSITCAGVGALMFFCLFTVAQGTMNLREDWANIHRQHNSASFPDVQHLEGSVDLRPGRLVTLDLTMTLLTSSTNISDSAVFSLNPGYKFLQLFIDGNEHFEFSFKAGLLKLPVEALPRVSHKVRVLARGRLDDRFAYLDQTRNFQKLTDEDVPRLGLQNSIFRTDYVALLPGVTWYPISGVVTDRDILEQHPRDLFTSNITVRVPREWQVAMAGTRELVPVQEGNSFKFKNPAPLPELALLAAEFERRSASVEGVRIDVLFSKKHSQNLDSLTPFVDDIHRWITGRINDAAVLSLRYPYSQYYVVEVPSRLRIYGGGWSMGTVLQPPGMMLIRETTLPTLDINSLARIGQSRGLDEPEGQYSSRFRQLWEYIDDDLQGGSPFAGIARNFVSHQVSATGQGATTLQYLLEQLSTQLIVRHESCFIVSVSQCGEHIGPWGDRWSDYYRFSNAAKQTRMDISSLPSTWNFMDRIPLFDLPLQTEPISSYRVQLSKVFALAKSMIEYYGEEKIGVFLENLLANYQGQSFTYAEFLDTALIVDLDLNEWVLPWFHDTKLPGYLVTSATVSKLSDPSFNEAEYQTAFVLNNAEPVSGFVRLVWSEDEDRNYWHTLGDFTYSDPMFLKGHQSFRIAIQSQNPLTGLRVEPVLALNRLPIEVFLPTDDESIGEHSSTLPFAEEIKWRIPETTAIIVDDLDSGFSIVTRATNSDVYLPLRTTWRVSTEKEGLDHGLVAERFPRRGEWNRVHHAASYGHYRRTYTRIPYGDQTSAARFAVNLPHKGHWKLEFFVPLPVFQSPWYGSWIDFFGTRLDDNSSRNRPANPSAPNEHYRLEISDGTSRWKQKFDIGSASEGWNDVGKFELDSTEVEVLLSDYAGHKDIMVHADAIRWTPIKPD